MCVCGLADAIHGRAEKGAGAQWATPASVTQTQR
jgi:hypothetical protein